jgi:membrane fusion protein
LARHQSLADSGFISALQLQQKQEESMDQDARLKALERARITLARERKTLQLQKQEIIGQSQNDLAQLDRQVSALAMEQVENESRRAVHIAAPKSGTVHAISYTAGQNIAVGNVLASIVPQGTELEAQLVAPSRAMGFVGKGQRVLIRYAAYPYQKYGLQSDTVIEVAQNPMAQDSAGSGITNGGDSLYRITVHLAAQAILAQGESNLLKPGMALEADIVQERRKIYEWFLEPILGFKKSIGV